MQRGMVKNNVHRAPILLIVFAILAAPAAAQKVIVPDVVGIQLGIAEEVILEAGLTVGEVTFEESFVVPVGQVMSQQPLAGTGALVGSPVNLMVSAGVTAVIVPNIVGLTRTSAIALIQSAGLVVGTVVEQFSTSFPAGTVLSQNPDAGTVVAPRTAVGFSVSIGAGTVTVPNVVGLQQAIAEVALIDAGLAIGPVTTLPSTEIPAGQVIAQNPAAGAVVDLGTDVLLTVSSGQTFVLVPTLVGLTRNAAVVALNAVGLVLGNVTLRSSATVPAGIVISQSPVAGVAVSAGSSVNLVVSSGLTQTIVPNVIGLGLVAAEQAILNAGLTIGTISEEANPAVPAGQVFEQDPPPNTLVAPGTSVDLTVSAGPQLVIVPNVVGLLLSAAQTAIVNAGFVLGEVTEQPSVQPPGTVLIQIPPAGVTAPLGSTIDLVIASEVQQVLVPNVVGLQEEDARSDIIDAGLAVGTIVRQPSQTVPAGQVILQSPAAGSLVAPNTAVNLVISTGSGQAIVPDVVGLTSTAAQAAIIGAGLAVGTITTQTSPTVPEGNVIAQTPTAGTSVAVGTAVDLVVSAGPTGVFVPDVVGLTLQAAQTQIVNAGLSVGNVTTRFTTTVPPGQVLEQDPVAGTIVTQGSPIDLVISTRTQNVVVPNVVGLTLNQATATLISAGLTVGTVTERSSQTVPFNDIISQSPGAGSTVPSGTPVSLVVSTGPAQTPVPGVVGFTLSQAELSLALVGFALGTVTAVESSLPVNQVISQFPPAGQPAAPGSTVDLTVSAGISPATVPNLIGLAFSSAQQLIELEGFTLGLVQTRPDPFVPADEVLDQDPSPGTLAPAGAEIDLVVSEGIFLVEVPHVVGLQLEEAETLLEDADLVLGTVTQQQSQQPSGEILSQFPAAGVETNAGAVVDLMISQGAAALPRPLNLTASQGTFNDFVRVAWDPVAGAASYQLFRSVTQDFQDALSLATVSETAFDDTTAEPPEVVRESPGCFAPPEDVVVFSEYYYWVQSISDDAESELTGPELGYRGFAEQRNIEPENVGLGVVILAGLLAAALATKKSRRQM